MAKEPMIRITKNGPYIVSNLKLFQEKIIYDQEGVPIGWEIEKEFPVSSEYALCRCGRSKSMPFCDSSHLKGFSGNETASKEKFDNQAAIIEGPELKLKDNQSLCAGAGFCHISRGTWDLVENQKSKEDKKLAIQSACNCPSGRLVIHENGKDLEPSLRPSISIINESGKLGPIWVKGKVKIVSDEKGEYEKRNRVTLCRCGRSENKPFCDSSHHN